MDEDISERTVREAMFNDMLWDELTAPAAAAREVQHILMAMREQIKADRERKQGQVAAAQTARSTGQITAESINRVVADYANWKQRVGAFSGKVEQRIIELRSRLKANEALLHRERAVRSQRIWQALALAIHAHQSETISDGDLYDALDAIHFAFGAKGDMSLRDAIDGGLLRDHGQHLTFLVASDAAAQVTA